LPKPTRVQMIDCEHALADAIDLYNQVKQRTGS
jgi:hypothetical protein